MYVCMYVCMYVLVCMYVCMYLCIRLVNSSQSKLPVVPSVACVTLNPGNYFFLSASPWIFFSTTVANRGG